MSDKEAMSPAKAISRWADAVNWILLNATSVNIPAHLRTTLEEECLRIRAAVAHEQPPASPSAADKQSRRMKAHTGEPPDTYHSQEHDEKQSCGDWPPCEPVDPSAPLSLPADAAGVAASWRNAVDRGKERDVTKSATLATAPPAPSATKMGQNGNERSLS